MHIATALTVKSVSVAILASSLSSFTPVFLVACTRLRLCYGGVEHTSWGPVPVATPGGCAFGQPVYGVYKGVMEYGVSGVCLCLEGADGQPICPALSPVCLVTLMWAGIPSALASYVPVQWPVPLMALDPGLVPPTMPLWPVPLMALDPWLVPPALPLWPVPLMVLDPRLLLGVMSPTLRGWAMGLLGGSCLQCGCNNGWGASDCARGFSVGKCLALCHLACPCGCVVCHC
jgi:hypothetical protein